MMRAGRLAERPTISTFDGWLQLMTHIIRPFEKSVVKGDVEDERPSVDVADYQIYRPSREIFWIPKMTKRRVAEHAA